MERTYHTVRTIEDRERDKAQLEIADESPKEFNTAIEIWEYHLRSNDDMLCNIGHNIKVLKFGYDGSDEFFIRLGILYGDLEDSMFVSKRSINHLEKFKNHYAWKRGLIDTHIAAVRSNNSAALASIAFFFIPIPLVTSVFGMNVRELGSGIVPIWQAILSATVAIVLAGFLWAISGVISRQWNRLSERVQEFQGTRHHWWHFTRVHPGMGLWLILFMLTHDPQVFKYGIEYCGLETNKEWASPEFISGSAIATMYRRQLKPFWEEKLNQVCDISRVREWDYESFVTRFWNGSTRVPNSS